jgi:pimeloyl-ACP methyl ester carboxylesterase
VSGRTSEPRRGFTAARIIALIVIAPVVLGLMFLGLTGGTSPVSVPAGAHVGQLKLTACTYPTEKGSTRADCGTLVVPENRTNPHARMIALPVIVVRAISAHPSTPIFRLNGGPGVTNMVFPDASRFTANHDVVLVGYRGVDGSSVLNCPEVSAALDDSADMLGQASFQAYANGFRACATRLKAEGVDLAGYGIPEQVDDFEAARQALGYKQIDLISESAGTRTAMIYAERYPKSIYRSVMIGANPPGDFLFDTATIDQEFQSYARLCAASAICSSRTNDLIATIKRTAANMPDRFLFLPIKKGNVLAATAFGMQESTDADAPDSAPMTIDAWLSAAKGDPSGLWFESFLASIAFPQSFVWGQFASFGSIDFPAVTQYFAHPDPSIIGSPGTAFLFGGGELVNAWPAASDEGQYMHLQASNVQTLVISGALDMATPAQNATTQLMPYLPNGHQVVLPQLGHADSFWSYDPAGGTALISTYLATGQVDQSQYASPHLSFTPASTQTGIAKDIVATMIGFAVLMVVSLLLMWWRIRRRGRFSRKASAVLRSVYPLILGLGGWFFGVLIVLTTSSTISIDDQLLAVVAIGVPIGLGIYLAWVNRGRQSKGNAIGVAAAAGGALAGAWLGFQATGGLLALVTAIVGAIVGANLSLLAFDISWGRQPRDRVDETNAAEAKALAAAHGAEAKALVATH